MSSSIRSFALLAAATGSSCAVGPAWTESERQQLDTLQQAVLQQLAAGTAALTTNAVVTLPEGRDLGDVNLYLQVYPPLAESGDESFWHSWGIGGEPRLPGRLLYGDRDVTLAVADCTLGGFDAVHGVTVQPTLGAVLLATRRGERTVATATGVWSGSLWHERFGPMLSVDGSHFVYVEDGWLPDRVMLASTAAPLAGTAIELPGVVQWPVWPGRDGSRLRAIVLVDGHVEVLDGDRVVATADQFAHPYFDAARDQLHVTLKTAGKARMLIGDRLTPPLDSYRWLERSRDGLHYAAVGRDGEFECVVVDGEVVARAGKIAWMTLAADGSTWACAVEEGEQCFVVRPDGRSGPLGQVTEMVLAPDGSALAVCTRIDRQRAWAIDGTPLPGYHDVRDLQLLPRGAGAVFLGRDDDGWWLVTPRERDGPWQHVERLRRLDDGAHVCCLAQRDREAHRRVLRLR